MAKANWQEIEDKVYGTRTKHKEGFTNKELELLLSEFPGINMDKVDNALTGITCMMKEDEIIIYHCDIVKAIVCGIENRELSVTEFD